jgi:hypothetical protein
MLLFLSRSSILLDRVGLCSSLNELWTCFHLYYTNLLTRVCAMICWKLRMEINTGMFACLLRHHMRNKLRLNALNVVIHTETNPGK